MARVVANALYNPQALGLALSEKHSVSWCQELRSLDETEGNKSTVTGPDERPVDVDYRACLADGSNVQHGLVPRCDGGCVRQD